MAQERLRSIPDRRSDASRPLLPRRPPAISAASSSARIDRPNPDTKRLRIEVTPGAPVTGREIRFAGNAALDDERLEAEIAEAGVEVEAWLDRTVVERALRQVYNEEGFLKAEIVGRPLTIEGTIGVLVIDIKEGPRAQITDVKWAGVGESRLAEVREGAGDQDAGAVCGRRHQRRAAARRGRLSARRASTAPRSKRSRSVDADDTVVADLHSDRRTAAGAAGCASCRQRDHAPARC